MRHICHIDESGTPLELLSPDDPNSQPALVVVGLIVPEGALAQMEEGFLNLRRRINPGGIPEGENKGKGLSKSLRHPSPRRQNFALSVLGEALGLLESAEARVAGQIRVKPIGAKIDGEADYVRAILSIAANFHRILEEEKSRGRIICDGRRPGQNAAVERDFLAWKIRDGDDAYPRLPNPLVFERSENQAGIQLADWLCSGIIAPLASTVLFGESLPNSSHVHGNFLLLKRGENSPWARLMRMQFPFVDDDGQQQPGILVNPERFRGRLFPPEPIFGDEAE